MRQSADRDNGLRPFHVLHIGPSLCDGTGEDSVSVGLRLLNISDEHQLDVYLGLAWLTRACHGEQAHSSETDNASNTVRTPESAPFVGVIVCVDELVLAEHEFFTLTSDYAGLHGVYVYSCYGDSGSVQRAIAHGATGELTDEVFAALRLAINGSLTSSEPETIVETAIAENVIGEQRQAAAIAKTTEPVMPKLVKPAETQPTILDESEVDTSAEAIDETTDDEYIEDEEEDDLIGPVQVPWDRRPAPPQRSAPPQRAAGPQQPAAAPPPSAEAVNPNRAKGNGEGAKPPFAGRPKHQPLLSPEELRALIGEIENTEPLEDQPQGDHEGA